MSFITADLILVNHANGYGFYRYDTEDTHADVDTDGYFNNADDTLLFVVGDIIDVVVWSTAVRTGTISTYGRHIIRAVTAAGIVDVTNVTVGEMTSSD